VRAGAVSAAAMRVPAVAEDPGASFPQAHCGEEEYAAFLDAAPILPAFRRHRLQQRRRFVRLWPDLRDWLVAPLDVRVGRLWRQPREAAQHRVSYLARGYLYYLALTDRVRLDYEWLLALGTLRAEDVARQLGIDLGIDTLSREAANLGFHPVSARLAMHWSLSRIALHTGIRTPSTLGADHLDELLAAVRRLGARPDIGLFWASAERYRTSPAKAWITHVGQLRLVLYHRGQIAEQPRKVMPVYALRPPLQPAMHAVTERWLAVRRPGLRPSTAYHHDLAVRRFIEHLGATAPDVTSFAQVTRAHILAWMAAMAIDMQASTGRSLSVQTRRNRVSALGQFLRDAAAWGWEGMPARPLIDHRDLPRQIGRVPRFIPADELDRLMAAIHALDCPYQRAALLTARWCGARRGEVQRLALDCLDRYPDGTARLRIPAGKTGRERVVPLHDAAADALRGVAALRAVAAERPLLDERTGEPVRYLFVRHGKLLSLTYLFETPLQRACGVAGLVDARGRGMVSAHRFRHTVGTQLAERGAKLHTIMRVLGHESPSMSMVYARISDPEVLRDYRAVLGPGAVIAGLGAEAVRGGTLGAGTVDWLKTNFLKTELELGHCLRLPAEGPCECDLFLTCSRFVTTPAYAPRLRERYALETRLAEDAQGRGWPHEVERHRGLAKRIERLLADLGEPLDG
jgi:integrase